MGLPPLPMLWVCLCCVHGASSHLPCSMTPRKSDLHTISSASQEVLGLVDSTDCGPCPKQRQRAIVRQMITKETNMQLQVWSGQGPRGVTQRQTSHDAVFLNVWSKISSSVTHQYPNVSHAIVTHHRWGQLTPDQRWQLYPPLDKASLPHNISPNQWKWSSASSKRAMAAQQRRFEAGRAYYLDKVRRMSVTHDTS